MSPIWSILHDHIASGEDRPVHFFYGARTQADLFYLDRIAALTDAQPARSPSSRCCRHADDDADWTRRSAASCTRWSAPSSSELGIEGDGDVYACGPPPMIDALQPVLFMHDFDPDRIFFDKFTPSTASVGRSRRDRYARG